MGEIQSIQSWHLMTCLRHIDRFLDGSHARRRPQTAVLAPAHGRGPAARFPARRRVARLQPSNRYVLLDMQRADTSSVPEDNAVGLQVALEQAMLEEKLPILRRVEAVLAGPGHAELRMAFAAWLRWSWEEDYGVFAGGGKALRRELDRMENAGEVVAMGSLAVERWKERNRKKEAQIFAEGLEFVLQRQAALRFGADAGARLSALLADVSEPERLAAVGDAIIECGTGAELLAAAERIVGGTN